MVCLVDVWEGQMTEPQGRDQDNVVKKTEQSLSELANTAANQAADLAQQAEEQIRQVGEQTGAAAAALAGEGQQKLGKATEQGSAKLDSAAHVASGALHDAGGSA